jgi:predicted RNA-binding protein with TRAM domain
MVYTFQIPLSEGITYEVTIKGSAMDLDNETFDGDKDGVSEGSPMDDYSWQFTTMAETPKVSSHFPSQGAIKIFTDSSIIFNFSKAMEIHNTLDALSYEVDSVNFPASSNGQVTWSNGDSTLTFTPFGNFQNNKTHIFIISHSATDENGIFFDGDGDGIGGEGVEDDFKLTFTTIPLPPKIQTISPRKQETNVEVDSIISIKFSKHMDKTSVEDAFSFTHESTNTTWYASNGNISWPSLLKMEFEPSFDLVYEKVYTVRIEATARDSAGITLDGNKNKKPEGSEVDSFEWSFTTITEPPEIVSVEPLSGTQNVKLNADIVMNFDRSMDTRSTEDAFSYSYQGSPDVFDSSSGIIIWTNNDRTMTFTPDVEYEEGETYTVTIDSTAEDAEGIHFLEYSWPFSTKINSEPVLEGGGVHPEKGDSSETFTFSIIYSDEDDDEPLEIFVVINEVDFRMSESDSSEDSFIDGKAYEHSIELASGTHEYYFMVENEKHSIRYPEGSVSRNLKVTEVEKELVFGVFEEEYAGMPTMTCMPLGIIILIIIIVVVAISSKKRRARTQGVSFQSFEPGPPGMEFSPADSGEFMSFEPEIEEDLMSFQAFEDEVPLESAQPVMIQCPECGEHLKVRSSVRPFQFPCKCGAKLVLR